MYYPPNPDIGDQFWNEIGEYCVFTQTGWNCTGPTPPTPPDVCEVIQLTATSGQILFPLGQTLTNPLCSTLFVNGQQQRLGFHYNFNSTFDTLIWNNVDFILEPIDLIDLKIK
jgi:hypothetical protein